MLSSWLWRFVNVLRRERVDADLDEEMQFHLAARAEEFVRDGLSPREADAKAKQWLGHSLLLRESSREIKLFPRLDSIVRDVRYGLRQLHKNTTVTAAAVLSLSLAIGACTTAFALIDALILRPLPVHEPGGLVYGAYRPGGSEQDSDYFNYPLFERMREASRQQVRLFGMSYLTRYDAVFDGAGSGARERLYPQWISGNALETLGIHPALGRLLTAADDAKPGQHPVAVISYEFWSRRFGRSPAALGRWFTVNGKRFQIVGVAQKGFTGVEPGFMTDAWVPNMMWHGDALANSGANWFRLWGRLEPGISAAQARELLQAMSLNFRRERQFPADEPPSHIEKWVNTPLHLRPAAHGASRVRQSFEQPLWVLAAIALLVLLIACSNVASLLVARTASRGREMALRVSIGAGRARLIQQVLVESSLLAIAAMAGGALIALAAAPQVVALLSPSNNAIRLDLQLDWRAIAFLAGLGSLVTFLFGLIPALRASAVASSEALKSGGARHSASTRFFLPLVAAQTAAGFVVLFTAGLFLATFVKLVRSDLGFDPQNLTVVSVEATGLNRKSAGPIWRQVMLGLQARPGIQSAGMSGFALFEGPETAIAVLIPGHAPESPALLEVSPGFLETMNIRLLQGRHFDWRDATETPSAAIVNESFARLYFPGQSAVGKSFAIRLGRRGEYPQTIAGVVRDARYKSIRDPAPPTLYWPSLPAKVTAVIVRTQLNPTALQALVQAELDRVGGGALRIGDVTPQSAFIDNVLVQERVLALLAGFFSVVSIVLVAVGLYGVLSYGVVQSTREIGIRLAVGATPADMARRVLSQAGMIMAIGLLAGVPAGIAAARLMEAMLYGVTPTSLGSVAVPVIGLALIGAIASLAPALRAARVDPITALRFD